VICAFFINYFVSSFTVKKERSVEENNLLQKLNEYEKEILLLRRKVLEIDEYASFESYSLMSNNNFTNVENSSKTFISLLAIRKRKVEIVIAIKSGGSKGFERRAMQRKTWLSVLNLLDDSQVSYFFALANHSNSQQSDAIKIEMLENNDMIVFPNIQDGYNKLTLKLLAILKHVYAHFEFKYLVIVDDDTFVNSFLLFDLYQSWPTTNYYSGNLMKYSIVITNSQHRNYEEFYTDSPYFPPVSFLLEGLCVLCVG
jgi:hypothetical protein